MDNRVTGLILAILALTFLWLYDTGRWKGVAAAMKATGSDGGGQAPLTTAPVVGPGGGTTLPGIPGLGNAIAWPGTNGQQGNDQLSVAICAAWPEACPFTPYMGVAKSAWNNTIGKIIPIHL